MPPEPAQSRSRGRGHVVVGVEHGKHVQQCMCVGELDSIVITLPGGDASVTDYSGMSVGHGYVVEQPCPTSTGF